MQTVKKKCYKFILTVLGLALFTVLFNLMVPAIASAEISVTITGDGVAKPITFTQAELEGMPQGEVCLYSTINTWPTKKIYVAEGVRLSELLDKAEIKPEAQLITITSVDTFEKTITRKQLEAPRYYFPGLKENHEYFGYIPGSPEGAVKVDTILALRSVEGSNDPLQMNSLDAPLLVMGQRWVTEQTNELFVKKVATIEVSTTIPEQWENPAATPIAGTVVAGTGIELSTSNMNEDNIHYTTDGSDPTFQSSIYNWVKKRWWGDRADDLAQINKPIEITRDTIIKAIAIGAGKVDSDIVTYNYQVDLDPAPELTADITDNKVGQSIEITFTDNELWRAAITAVNVDDTPLAETDYTLEENKLTIKEGVLNQVQDYVIVVQATGFVDASVIQTIVQGLKIAPELTADVTDNKVGQSIEISFIDDELWRAAITGVNVDDTPLTETDYTLEESKLTIKEGILNRVQDYVIVVQATGFVDASVTQTIVQGLKIAPELTADVTDNKVGQSIEIAFTDDELWRAAITGVNVDDTPLAETDYTLEENKLTIKEGVLNQVQDYVIVVQATGFVDASVVQPIVSELQIPPVLLADSINNKVGQSIEIKFEDDELWRAAIMGVSVDDTPLAETDYTLEESKLTIKEGVLNQVQDYVIVVQANGYIEASVSQKILALGNIIAPTSGQEFKKGEQVIIKGYVEASLTNLNVKVTGSNGQTIYGPENVELTEGKFETSFTLSSSTETGIYTITMDGESLPGTIVSTFIVKAGSSGGEVNPSEDVVLTITGSGVAKELEFTLSQLKGMEQYENVYSVINTWPSKKWYVGKGVSLKKLLDLAGMKRNARLIKFTASDGYTTVVTVKELLRDTRYYFPNFKSGNDGDGHVPGSRSGAQRVEAILALESAEGTDNSNYMNDRNALLFMMGQRAVTEQTCQLFVKNLSEIEVLSATLSTWDEPKASPDGGDVPAGTLVRLSNYNMDDDKIYYTTDGSIPTVNSPMYNWIANRWWSSREDDLDTINHPIEITKNTTIKAITIGPGKKDSEIVTFSYQVKGNGSDRTNLIETIKPDTGGTISFADEASIEIPANALKENNTVEVKVEKVESAPAAPSGFKLLGNVYEFSVGENDSYDFAGNVTIKLTFDPELVDENETPAIYYYDEALSQWVNLGGSISGNTITVQVNHFTKFAVLTVSKEKQQNAEFKDITGHWAQESINKLIALECISGYPDGTFKPNKTITRAEFTTMLVKAFKLKNSGCQTTFLDTASHWAKDFITCAVFNKVVNGYDTNTFGPDDLITREQMAVMIAKAAKLVPVVEEAKFADSGSISDFAREAIATVNKNRIMQGYPDNTIHPQGSATRAEAVTVIVNALDKVKK